MELVEEDMDIQGVKSVFRSYLVSSLEGRIRIELQDGEKHRYCAWDELFYMFGEGDTPEKAVRVLSETLEDYLDYIIDCDDEDRIRKHRDSIVVFVSK